MNIRAIIKSHWVAILVAVVVGVISVAPQIYVLKDQNYKGIQMFGTDAEYDYVANINKSYYDDYSKGIFPADEGKEYYLAPRLGEKFIAVIGSILHVSAAEINVLSKFVFPFLLFLTLYFWLLSLFSLKSVALIAPLFVILGINLLDLSGFLSFVSLKSNVDTFLPYTRPINPQISSIILFLCLWITYRLMTRLSKIGEAVLLGLISGISLYVYVYTWSFAIVLLGVCFLYNFFKTNWARAKYFLISIFINGIISLPFFINLFKARLDADYIDTSVRIGLMHSHAPIIGGWLIVGFILLLFLWPKAYEDSRKFFLLIFTTLFIVLNQQIVTGLKLQPGHFHWYFTKPFIAIFIIFLIFSWLEKISSDKKTKMAISLFLSLIFLTNAVIVQGYSYSANYQIFKDAQKYAPILNFLQSNFSKKEVVWAPENLSLFVLSYTRHNAPNTPYASQYLSSDKRLEEITLLNKSPVFENSEELYKTLGIGLVVIDGNNKGSFDKSKFLFKIKDFESGLSVYRIK